MNDFNPDDDLTADELRVVNLWRKGLSMTQAYCKIMLPKTEKVSQSALKKRVIRFFQSKRIRAAMESTAGWKGNSAKKKFDRDDEREREKAFKSFKKEAESNPLFTDEEKEKAKANSISQDEIDTLTQGNGYLQRIMQTQEPDSLNEQYQELKSARDRWRESLQITDTPSIMSVTGSALFIMNTAISEIIERKAAIKREGVSILKTTALPSNLVSAFKASADVILPFAPPPTAAERKEMSKAGQILCSLISNINEKPEDYAVSSQGIIDVVNENDSNEQEDEE